MLYVLGRVSQEGGILVGAKCSCPWSLTQACHPHKGWRNTDNNLCMAFSYYLEKASSIHLVWKFSRLMSSDRQPGMGLHRIQLWTEAALSFLKTWFTSLSTSCSLHPFQPRQYLISVCKSHWENSIFFSHLITLCVACGRHDEAAVLQHKNRDHMGTWAMLNTKSLSLLALKSMENVHQLHQSYPWAKPKKFPISTQEVSGLLQILAHW